MPASHSVELRNSTNKRQATCMSFVIEPGSSRTKNWNVILPIVWRLSALVQKPSMAPDQWFQTLGPQMCLDYSCQKPRPAQLVVKSSGSFSPRTSGHLRLGTAALDSLGKEGSFHMAFFSKLEPNTWYPPFLQNLYF